MIPWSDIIAISLVVVLAILVIMEFNRNSWVIAWCAVAVIRSAEHNKGGRNAEIAEKYAKIRKSFISIPHLFEFVLWVFKSKKSCVLQMKELTKIGQDEIDINMALSINVTYDCMKWNAISSVPAIQLISSLYGELSLLLTRLGISKIPRDIIYLDVERIREQRKNEQKAAES